MHRAAGDVLSRMATTGSGTAWSHTADFAGTASGLTVGEPVFVAGRLGHDERHRVITVARELWAVSEPPLQVRPPAATDGTPCIATRPRARGALAAHQRGNAPRALVLGASDRGARKAAYGVPTGVTPRPWRIRAEAAWIRCADALIWAIACSPPPLQTEQYAKE